jgi:Zn-dependent protease
MGLAGVPATLAASLVVVFGWLVALVATAAADSWNVGPTVRLLGGLVVSAVAVVVGSLAASVLARPLGHLFVTTEAETNVAFVGRTCTIRTAGVSTSFGQAEAADPSGATVLVQVRVSPSFGGQPSASFARGDQALIFDYDPAAEVFLVCPVDALEAGADGLS